MSNAESWDYADDYMSQTLTRETPHGVFRAVIEVDQYAEAPDFDMGCPVFRINTSRYWSYGVSLDDKPEIGDSSWMADGVDIHAALDHFSERGNGRPLEMLDRWLRIFHGGSCTTIHSTMHQGGDDFLVYDTRAMRESWGQTGETLETSDPESPEWQAFIDGEVFGIRVEQGRDFDDDGDPQVWDEVDDSACWGYYSEEYARQAALEQLDFEVQHIAEGMLPLVGESA